MTDAEESKDDRRARIERYMHLLWSGLLTPNEVRRLNGLPPFKAGGDVLRDYRKDTKGCDD